MKGRSNGFGIAPTTFNPTEAHRTGAGYRVAPSGGRAPLDQKDQARRYSRSLERVWVQEPHPRYGTAVPFFRAYHRVVSA